MRANSARIKQATRSAFNQQAKDATDTRSKLANLLACPDCHVKVAWAEDFLSCSKCGQRFPVVRGVPVMFSKHSEQVRLLGNRYFGEETEGERLRKRLPSFLTQLPSTSIEPTKHQVAYNRYVMAANDDALILNLGSGSEKTGTKQRAKGGATIINLDIFPHGETDVVGDGHCLPFVNSAFDGVYITAVLEHVFNPFVVAQETTRVLKHGGFVLVATPFIFPLHSAPTDYFRFTDDGLRQLFPGFKEIECAAHRLPTRGLIEFLKAYAAAFCDNRYLAYALTYVVSYLLYPLKYLDKYLQKKEGARNVCSSFYYVGLKEPAGASLSDMCD